MKYSFLKQLIAFGLTALTLLSCGSSQNKNDSGRQQVAQDLAKLLAMQSQNTQDLPPLENVEVRKVDIPFITKADTVSIRPVHMFIPQDAKRPMPVVYIPHYEMKEDAAELRLYLKEGWAVVSPTDFINDYNGQLTDDDLVFNNAALYTVRHTADFDPERILLVGGSAGGYMTMMLNALQMGICASIAQAPIQNVYFNFYKHFNAASEVNKGALLKLLLKNGGKLLGGSDEEKAEALMNALMDLPLPFVGLTSGMFEPIQSNFPDKEDVARWEALSPVGLGDCYSSPFIVFHCTSDLLVPVDQTTRRFTYEKNGESMPKGYSTRLPKDYPGKLGHSLEEELPAELTYVKSFPIIPVDSTMVVPYNPEKPFNLMISDDGPVESYGSHNTGLPAGTMDMIPYLKDMVGRTLSSTEMARKGKIRLLLERYLGRSVQLPAHSGIDDTAYGSLAVYKEEVIEELGRYAKNHSLKELEEAALAASAGDAELLKAWNEVKSALR